MTLSKNILADEGVQINVHVLKYKVNIAMVLGPYDFFQFDDIGMA